MQLTVCSTARFSLEVTLTIYRNSRYILDLRHDWRTFSRTRVVCCWLFDCFVSLFASLSLNMPLSQQKSLLMYIERHSSWLLAWIVHTCEYNEDNEYNLRSSADINIKIPQPYTEYLKRSLSYDGAALWYSLPNSIRNVSTLQTFQNLINVYCV